MTMTEQTRKRHLKSAAAFAVLIAVAACGGDQNRTDKAPVEYRQTKPGSADSGNRPPSNAGNTGGVVTEDGSQFLLAQEGDTVAAVAARNGVSASELAGYNGLTPDSRLNAGQELVVPPGSTARTAPVVAEAPASRIEERALEPASDGGTDVTEDGSAVTTDGVVDGTAAPADAPAPTTPPSGWTPDLAADAIARSTGIKEDGELGAPPSSTDPVPGEPTAARDLTSPGLDQYQTEASEEEKAAAAAAAEEDKVAATDAAAHTPTPGSAIKLRRPVKGPIAVGFGEGSGPAKNDGVDFAAAAGAPVVAAADGEVALVSDTLGGLGTIVLIRHGGELLTVYGRIDKVTVRKGDFVKSGQRIGVVSDAAAPAKPRMHFEVRRGATVMDPMQFL